MMEEKKEEAELEEKAEEKKEDQKIIQKYEKQLKIIVIGIFFVILGFVAVYYYAQSLNKFELSGFDWEKIKSTDRNVNFYHARFPITAGVFYNLYLENDPRKIDVPVNGNLEIKKNVIIAISTNATLCYGAAVPMAKISEFLSVIGGKVEVTLIEEENARALNKTAANCSSSNENQSVLLMQKTEKTGIYRDSEFENCYHLDFGNCENLKVTEKFIVALMGEGKDDS